MPTPPVHGCSVWPYLAAAGYLDVAVRDVVRAIAAFTLAKLTEVREESASHALDAVAVRPSRRVTA